MEVAKLVKCVAAIKPRTEAEAAEAMWVYYRDKAQLVSHIKEYRAQILAELMAGETVEAVFAQYFSPIEQVRNVRRAA